MDESQLRELLEQHHEAGFGWALHCCGHRPQEAEDVLQTTYLKVLGGQARYDGRAAFRTWLFAVIRHTAADERRRHWMRSLGLTRLGLMQPADPPQPSPASGVARTELQRVFREELPKLPQRQREVLHLVFYQDMTLQEAADVLGLSVGSVRQHYDRGKQRLRERLGYLEGYHGPE